MQEPPSKCVQVSLAAGHTSPMVQSKSNRVTWHRFALIQLSESQFKRANKGQINRLSKQRGHCFLSFLQEVESNTLFVLMTKLSRKIMPLSRLSHLIQQHLRFFNDLVSLLHPGEFLLLFALQCWDLSEQSLNPPTACMSALQQMLHFMKIPL